MALRHSAICRVSVDLCSCLVPSALCLGPTTRGMAQHCTWWSRRESLGYVGGGGGGGLVLLVLMCLCVSNLYVCMCVLVVVCE